MSDFHWIIGISLTLALYVFASVSSWRLADIVWTMDCRAFRERTIWQLESILLLILAANTALDGLGRLTTFFRAAAMTGGWYASRAPDQARLIVALLAVLVVAAASTNYWAHAVSRPALFALLMSLLLITFVLVRAVSLHAVDQIIFARFFGVTLSTMIEAGSVAAILALIGLRRVQAAH